MINNCKIRDTDTIAVNDIMERCSNFLWKGCGSTAKHKSFPTKTIMAGILDGPCFIISGKDNAIEDG